MDMNFSVFQEPRGVMRIIHFIFSICAFATITGYSGYIKFKGCNNEDTSLDYSYPFQLVFNDYTVVNNCTITVNGDFSSDAKFFVATGVLAFLYSIGIIIVYLKFDEAYRRNNNIPLADFVGTVFLGVLWLSSSGAWANGLTGLKYVTDADTLFSKVSSSCKGITCKSVVTSSFSTLNISVVFGFLNFFLWAADLWFLYKETAWFLGSRPQATSGV